MAEAAKVTPIGALNMKREQAHRDRVKWLKGYILKNIETVSAHKAYYACRAATGGGINQVEIQNLINAARRNGKNGTAVKRIRSSDEIPGLTQLAQMTKRLGISKLEIDPDGSFRVEGRSH